MDIFLTAEFISEVKAISKTPSHKDCEQDLINAVFEKDLTEIETGSRRLGGDPEKNPFLRKRVESLNGGKSSGYRLYLWLFKIEGCIYLMFIHPKSGRRSATNITHEKQKELVKSFKTLRDDKGFLKAEFCPKKHKIIYSLSGKNVF